jgi:hypothetical protein
MFPPLLVAVLEGGDSVVTMAERLKSSSRP